MNATITTIANQSLAEASDAIQEKFSQLSDEEYDKLWLSRLSEIDKVEALLDEHGLVKDWWDENMEISIQIEGWMFRVEVTAFSEIELNPEDYFEDEELPDLEFEAEVVEETYFSTYAELVQILAKYK